MCIPAVSAVQPDEPVTNPEPAEEAAQLPEGSDLGAILQGNKDAELEALQPETPKDTDLVRVIVELDAPALTEQSGMFAGKALTDAGRTAQQNAIAAQEQVEAKIAEAAPEASVRYSYSLLLNGIALECAYGHIAELEALPGVKAVHLVQTYELPTEPKVTSGGGMIGAPTAWNLGMDGSSPCWTPALTPTTRPLPSIPSRLPSCGATSMRFFPQTRCRRSALCGTSPPAVST